MNLHFVVPSFRRPRETVYRTLSTLGAGGVMRADVWLSDAKEEDAYRKHIDEARARGEDIPDVVMLMHGAPGLPANRNAIRAHYPAGDWIASLDDDVSAISRLTMDGSRLEPIDDLVGAFRGMARRADIEGATLVGLYPVHNAFYMSHRLRKGCWFVYGSAFLEQAGTEDWKQLREDLRGTRDDYERTLLHHESGRVLRYDNFAQRSDYLRLAGGLQEGGRDMRSDEAHIDYIVGRWPQWASRKTRPDGRQEIKLKAK